MLGNYFVATIQSTFQAMNGRKLTGFSHLLFNLLKMGGMI